MKYMHAGGFQSHPLMRWTLTLTLVLLLAFWVTNFGIYFSKMGLRPASVVTYYHGSEEDFRPPRTFGSMLEVTHAHLVMMAMVVLLLTHLVIFTPLPEPAKKMFIWGTFSAALLSESSGWLVRFVSPLFAPLKIAGFLTLQVLLASLFVSLACFLWGASRNNKRLTSNGPGSQRSGEVGRPVVAFAEIGRSAGSFPGQHRAAQPSSSPRARSGS